MTCKGVLHTVANVTAFLFLMWGESLGTAVASEPVYRSRMRDWKITFVG